MSVSKWILSSNSFYWRLEIWGRTKQWQEWQSTFRLGWFHQHLKTEIRGPQEKYLHSNHDGFESISNIFFSCAGLTATKVSDHRFDPAAGPAVPNFGDPAVRDGSDSDSDSEATLTLGSWDIRHRILQMRYWKKSANINSKNARTCHFASQQFPTFSPNRRRLTARVCSHSAKTCVPPLQGGISWCALLGSPCCERQLIGFRDVNKHTVSDFFQDIMGVPVRLWDFFVLRPDAPMSQYVFRPVVPMSWKQSMYEHPRETIWPYGAIVTNLYLRYCYGEWWYLRNPPT